MTVDEAPSVMLVELFNRSAVMVSVLALCLSANAQDDQPEPTRQTSYAQGYGTTASRIPDPVLNQQFILEWTRSSIREKDYRQLLDTLKLPPEDETQLVELITQRNISIANRRLERMIKQQQDYTSFAERLDEDRLDAMHANIVYSRAQGQIKKLLGDKFSSFTKCENGLCLRDELTALNTLFEKELVRMSDKQFTAMHALLSTIQADTSPTDSIQRVQDRIVRDAADVLTGKQLNIYSKKLYTQQQRPEPYVKVLNIPEALIIIPMTELQTRITLDDTEPDE